MLIQALPTDAVSNTTHSESKALWTTYDYRRKSQRRQSSTTNVVPPLRIPSKRTTNAYSLCPRLSPELPSTDPIHSSENPLIRSPWSSNTLVPSPPKVQQTSPISPTTPAQPPERLPRWRQRIQAEENAIYSGPSSGKPSAFYENYRAPVSPEVEAAELARRYGPPTPPPVPNRNPARLPPGQTSPTPHPAPTTVTVGQAHPATDPVHSSPPLPRAWTAKHDRALCALDVKGEYEISFVIRSMKAAFPELRGRELTEAMLDTRLRQLDADVGCGYFGEVVRGRWHEGRAELEG